MFLGIAILGAIFIVITTFSIINAHRRGESKRGGIIVLVITVLVTIGAITQLPYWSAKKHSSDHAPAAQTSSKIHHSSGQAFSSSSTATTRADNEQAVKRQLAKSLTKLGTVSFNRSTKTYTLTLTNKGLKTTIKALQANPSQAKAAKWPKFVNNFIKTSQSLKEALGTGYSLVLRIDHQSPVLIFKDGYVTKNQFE